MLWKPFARLRVIWRSQKIMCVVCPCAFFRRFVTFLRALGHKRRTISYFSGDHNYPKINEVVNFLTKRDFSCFLKKEMCMPVTMIFRNRSKSSEILSGVFDVFRFFLIKLIESYSPSMTASCCSLLIS